MIEEPAARIAVATVIGLVVGSFLSALTWRLPRGESVAKGRSRCPDCAMTLAPRDLVPVLSWLAAGGRCRGCGTRISPRYPLVEAATACAFAAAAAVVPWPALAFTGLALATLVALAVVDIEHGLLPDVLVATLAAIFLAARVAEGETLGALVGGAAALAGALAVRWGFRLATGRDGLGLGDVKLFGAYGLVLAPLDWPLLLTAAGVLGLVTGLAWQAAGRGTRFPFGPALVAAVIPFLLWPGLGVGLLGGR